MARSTITAATEDLQSDSGAVLFSIVQGEQLEFPITLDFLVNASVGYTYEAVVMEGLNVLGATEPPVSARPAGINTTLTVWTPNFLSAWNPVTAYNRDDLVTYNGLYYILTNGTAYVSATSPNLDTPRWSEYVPNKVYVRFPSTLSTVGSGWNATAIPTTETKVYGFFELRVTEPSGGRYQKTWKPMRGIIEFLYSPTELVT